MADSWPRGRSRHGGVDEVPLPSRPGRLWLAGKRYVGPDPEAAMASVGATAVVCLCQAHELEDRYPAYVGWLLDRTETGLEALWRPVPDLHAPSPEEGRLLVADLVARLHVGEGLLVHCGAGMGRAGTVAAAVLMGLGSGLEEAIGAVAAARPGAGPEVGAQKELLVALSQPAA
jgi:protein-tyrosine phosphatase